MWEQKCENFGLFMNPTYLNLCWRFAPFPDIWQENYRQKWLWTHLIHIFWTLTAKRFHGYYLSDFKLNIFGYDPFGNKMQISTKILWNDLSACCGHDFADNNIPYSSFQPWHLNLFRVTSTHTTPRKVKKDDFCHTKKIIFVTAFGWPSGKLLP